MPRVCPAFRAWSISQGECWSDPLEQSHPGPGHAHAPRFGSALMLRFIGIGAQKAGTSWLHAQLARHPQVRFPKKELHFWNREYPAHPATDYLAHFTANPDLVEGDITPAYALLDEPTVRELVQTCPDVRVLFILRNPIERAWSSALMALQRAEMELDEASDAWFLDHFHSRGSLGRGDYARTLRVWRDSMPSGQLRVLDYRQIARDPQALLREVADFVGLPMWEGWTPTTLSARIFAGPSIPLPERLRELLERLYASRIEALRGQIDWDPMEWLEAPVDRGAGGDAEEPGDE
jgi:hypothetical protein